MSSVNRTGLVACSVVLVVLIHIDLLRVMSKFQLRKPDFMALYQAGRELLHKRFPMVVNRFPILNGQDYIAELSNNPYPPDNEHPPFEAIIFACLALLKYRFAYLIWYGCNMLMLLGVAFLLWKYVPHLQTYYPTLIILMATFYPAFMALVQGQNSILLLVLLTLCFTCLEKQRDFLGGLVLGMGMFKFVIVLPIVLGLAIEKRWRTLAGFAVCCIALLSETIALVGFTGFAAYVKLLAGYSAGAPDQEGASIMPNLRGFIYSIGSRTFGERSLMIATLALSICLLVFVNWRLVNKGPFALRFSAQVILAAIVSYHLYAHDASILLLPIILLLNHALDADAKSFRITVMIATAAIYLCPLGSPLQIGMFAVFAGSVAIMASLTLTQNLSSQTAVESHR